MVFSKSRAIILAGLSAVLSLGILVGCGAGSGGGASIVSNNGVTGAKISGGAPDKSPDFAFKKQVAAGSYDIKPGASQSFDLVLNSVNGFSSPVTLSGTVPTGWTMTFTPNSIALPVGDTHVTMTVTVPANAPASSYTQVQYKAVGGGLTRYDNGAGPYNTTLSYRAFSVEGIAINVPTSLTLSNVLGGFVYSYDVIAGSGASLTYVGTNSLSAATLSVQGLPTGVTAVFDKQAYTLGELSLDFTLVSSGTPAVGTYPITLKLVENGNTHTSSPFNLVVSPSATASNNLIVSQSSANTTVLKNGSYGGALQGQTYNGSVQFNNITFKGEYFWQIGGSVASEFQLFHYGIPVAVGGTFTFGTDNNVSMNYVEGTGYYFATSGTATITAMDTKTITIKVTNATFNAAGSVNGTPTNSTGTFVLNGTVVLPLQKHF